MAALETDVRAIGESLETTALTNAGLNIDTIQHGWQQRHDQALAHHLQAGEDLKASHAALTVATKHRIATEATHGTGSAEYAAALTAYDRAVHTFKAQLPHYNAVRSGYDDQTRADMISLANAYRDTLATHRTLGGPLTTSDTSTKHASHTLNQAVSVYPTDWVDASNNHGPLKAKTTKGRAHYAQSAIQKVRVKQQRHWDTHSGPTPPPVRPGDSVVWDQDGPPDTNGSPTWRAYWARVRRDPDWRSGVSVSGKRPRGYTERIETLPDGTEITVWAQTQTRMGFGDITAEILVDKSDYHQAQDTPGLATAIHEFAHRSEHTNPALGKLEEAFLVRRTTNPDGTRQPLERYGSTRSRERVRPDAFTNRYVGKTYSHSADHTMTNGEHAPTHREVISCGMESLFAGSNGALIGVGNYTADPDMRHFILGTLATA